MNIGENIKFFRRSKDMTQEELAEQLNVTVSAVSQWESEKTMPDISLLPKLAMIFEVSTDEILGFSEEKNKEVLESYKEKSDELYREHKYGEMVVLARNTLKELPNNYDVMFNLAFALGYMEQTVENKKEQIKICEYILSKCTDNKIRLRATNSLCHLYVGIGNKEKALYYISQLPHTMYNNQTRVKSNLGLIPQTEKIPTYQEEIASLYWMLDDYIMKIADADYKNPCQKATVNERIKMIEILIAICKLVYGEKLCDKNYEMYGYYRIIGVLYLFDGNDEKALDNFEIAYKYAIAFDENFNDGDCYSSLLLKGLESCDKSVWNLTPCQDMLDRFTKQERYDKLRENQRFITIMQNLKERCK